MQPQERPIDTSEFAGEELLKTWTLQYDQNYNRVALFCNRVVFQSQRQAGRVVRRLLFMPLQLPNRSGQSIRS
jgi:hypothetical protein